MITESISCISHPFAIHWARIHTSATQKEKPQKQFGDDLNPDVCKCERYGTISKACVKSPSPLSLLVPSLIFQNDLTQGEMFYALSLVP